MVSQRLRGASRRSFLDRGDESRRRLALGLIAMSLDPFLDVVELEPEMTAESVVGDRIVVPARGTPVDEGLWNADDLGNLLDVEIARREEESELLRLRRLVVVCHAATSTTGK
jgi:hypothetical protein